MKRLGWIGILVLLALAACDTTTREARRMIARAEQLVDTLPDCTVRLIDSVLRMPANLSERQRMDMALLQAEALFADHGQDVSPVMDDDFFDDHDDISTSPELERAADYYANKKQYAKAAHAALYNGFVQQHYDEKKAAMQSFKDAEQYGGLIMDSLTVAQAQYKMGRLLYRDGMMQEAIVLLKAAEIGFKKQYAEKALTENLLAICYCMQGNYDSSEICLHQSLLNADNANSNKVKEKTLNNFAVLYRLQGKYDQALDCLRQAINKSDDSKLFLNYLNMGKVFVASGELDSALYYYQKIEDLLPTADVKNETKVSAYGALSQFTENQNDNTQALKYRKTHENLLYEVMHQRQEQAVFHIQKQYDYESLQNSLNRKIILRHRLILIISILLFIAAFIIMILQYRHKQLIKAEAEIKDSLLRFMKQNEELTKQSEAVKKANLDLEQKHQEIEEARQNLAYQVEEYKNAYEASDKKLSKALQKEHQIMQKMAVFLENKKDSALFEALKYSVLGDQEYWNAMLRTFDRQFPGMRKELVLQYPELTETEQKILLLSYVDASREDTALLLGISIFMVDKLRTSVKKKMAKQALKNSEKA